MLTKNNSVLSDGEIIERANKAIIKELGPSGFIRYLRLRKVQNNGKDYLKENKELFGELSVEELSEQAKNS